MASYFDKGIGEKREKTAKLSVHGIDTVLAISEVFWSPT
jgi:hypothetical protein